MRTLECHSTTGACHAVQRNLILLRLKLKLCIACPFSRLRRGNTITQIWTSKLMSMARVALASPLRKLHPKQVLRMSQKVRCDCTDKNLAIPQTVLQTYAP